MEENDEICYTKRKKGGIVMGEQIPTAETVEDMLDITDAKKRIFMKLSHELRTPINGIYGCASLLAMSDNLGQKEREYANNILESTRMLKNVLNNIMRYTETVQEEILLEEASFSIRDLVDEVRAMISLRMQEKKLHFRICVDPGIPKLVYGDMKKLVFMLTGLLRNCIRYTEEGEIILRILPVSKENKKRICFEINDTGPYIENYLSKRSENKWESIESVGYEIEALISQKYLEAFHGAFKYEKRKRIGNRLIFEVDLRVVDSEPLISSKKDMDIKMLVVTENKDYFDFISKMCRSIDIDQVYCWNINSRPEKDNYTHILLDGQFPEVNEWIDKKMPYPCEIFLLLPSNHTYIENLNHANKVFFEPFTIFMLDNLLKDFNQMDHIKKKMKNELFCTQGVKALAVDDNSVNLMIVEEILKQYGIESDLADSGTMALQMYYNNKYDIVLMDYLMPDMDGIETVRKMRVKDKGKLETPIIALSANVSEEIRAQFLDAGAQDVIEKPLELKKLSQILKVWISEEKISQTKTKEAEETDRKNENYKDWFGQIEGFYWKDAMERMNIGIHEYIDILEVSCENGKQQLEALHGMKIEQGVDKYKIHFHSLKGVFLNIGAKKLSDFSKDLEIAAAENNAFFVEKYNQSYLEEAEYFFRRIKNILLQIKEEKELSEICELAEEEMEAMLASLKIYVTNFQYNEINDVLQKLSKGCKNEQRAYIEEARKALQRFDYEKVDECIEQIRERRS